MPSYTVANLEINAICLCIAVKQRSAQGRLSPVCAPDIFDVATQQQRLHYSYDDQLSYDHEGSLAIVETLRACNCRRQLEP